MALISEYVEREEIQPGVFQATIHSSPIAYRSGGQLLRIVDDFEDGDASHPNIVTRAPLRSRSSNNGTRRLYPVPDDDSKYLEIGAPFIQLSGIWTQVSLGTPTRSANKITWTRPQTITTITHAGHYSKLEIELRNGFVPENSRIAFPVGISGLTRSGVNILNNGEVVAKLRPFVMYDAANPDDERPIAHAFQNLSGQPYLVLTLPSLVGMARPVIDPTLTLQPDATACMDLWMAKSGPNNNAGVALLIVVGGEGTINNPIRGLLRFDLSTLPSGASVSSATMTLYCASEADSTDYAIAAHRGLTQWWEGDKNDAALTAGVDGSTWNLRNNNGSVPWAGGVGGGSGSDYAAVATDTKTITAPSTSYDFNVQADVQAFASGSTNYGWWLINTSENTVNSRKRFDSSDSLTSSQRPKLVVIYTVAYTLTADQASFTLTGQAANVLYGHAVVATQASFVLTGQITGLLFSHRLTATQASYTLDGQDVGLLYGRILVTVQASFALTGQVAGLLFGYLLAALQASYALTGQAVTLDWSGSVPVVTPDSRTFIVPFQNRTYIVR